MGSPQHWRSAQTSSLQALPCPVYFRAYPIPAGTRVEAHHHRWWQFMYAREGLIQVQAESHLLVLPGEYGMWIPPGCEHTLWTHDNVALESLYIDAAWINLQRDVATVVAVDPFAREFIHHCCTHLPDAWPATDKNTQKVQVLLDHLQSSPETSLTLPFPAEGALLTLCRDVQHAPHLPWLLEQVAQRVAMSPRTFSRHFTRATGIPWNQWRQRLRLFTALTQLRAGSSVTTAALAVGYATPSAFIFAFHQLFGVAPARFLRR